MRPFNIKSALTKSALAASFLVLASSASWAQTVNLTAAPTAANMPDGTSVPMWGYTCGALVANSTATCAASNPGAVTTGATAMAGAVMAGWSPVVITVPYVSTGTNLTINLTNNLSFTPTGAATANTVPTSLTVIKKF